MNTSTDTLEQDPPERDVLAGEYVLGVLDGSGRRHAQQLAQTSDEFGRQVEFWEERLAALAAEIDPVPVPDYVWARIASALGLAPAVRAPADATQSAEPGARSFWENLAFWRLLTAGGFAAAAVCLFALLNVVREPTMTPPPAVVDAPPALPSDAAPEDAYPAARTEMAATLAGDDGQPGYVATMDAATGRITVTPLRAAEEDGLVPELWLIPTDGVARSLGVFDENATHSSRIPEEFVPLLGTDALLAMTLEPPGGAPEGVATGPIVAKGGIQLLAMAP